MKTLIDLIARHHPSRDGAVALIEALEVVTGMAESYLIELEETIHDGLADESECDSPKIMRAALELVDD